MTTIAAECIHRAGAVLGEGPVWDAVRQRLWWVDIEEHELHCFDPAAGDDRVWRLEDRIGFAVPAAHGDFMVGVGGDLARFAPESGALTPFAQPENERAWESIQRREV